MGFGYSGYGVGNYAYNGYGGNNGGFNANGSGNANMANGQAAGGGNNPLVKFNPQAAQQPQPNVAATDAPNSPPLDLPARNWTSSEGDMVLEGKFVGVLDGNVVVRKSSGGITLLSLANLSDGDREYVSSVAGHKAPSAEVAADSQ